MCAQQGTIVYVGPAPRTFFLHNLLYIIFCRLDLNAAARLHLRIAAKPLATGPPPNHTATIPCSSSLCSAKERQQARSGSRLTRWRRGILRRQRIGSRLVVREGRAGCVARRRRQTGRSLMRDRRALRVRCLWHGARRILGSAKAPAERSGVARNALQLHCFRAKGRRVHARVARAVKLLHRGQRRTGRVARARVHRRHVLLGVLHLRAQA